jgi:hypothetical protein
MGMLTVVWLSWVVVNVFDFYVGMTVPLLTRVAMTPPETPMPRDKGVTSIKTISAVSSVACPPRIPPYTVAP